jgi:cytoskeletal protein CcmA (bactofilin family)
MSGTVIGSTIHIVGEIHGEEDLLILGSVQGKIFLKDSLVVDTSARVEADLETKTVEISGTVTGNVVASERVEIKNDGRVTGNIKAPRVTIADGALFRGSVEMER